jgi:hypothetical protein
MRAAAWFPPPWVPLRLKTRTQVDGQKISEMLQVHQTHYLLQARKGGGRVVALDSEVVEGIFGSKLNPLIRKVGRRSRAPGAYQLLLAMLSHTPRVPESPSSSLQLASTRDTFVDISLIFYRSNS